MREWREKAERTATAGTSCFFRNKKPPLTEGKVSTGVGVMSKMMCCAMMLFLRNK